MSLSHWIRMPKPRAAFVLLSMAALTFLLIGQVSLGSLRDRFGRVPVTLYTATIGGEFHRLGKALQKPLLDAGFHSLTIKHRLWPMIALKWIEYDEQRLHDDYGGVNRELRESLRTCIDKSDLFILLLTPSSDSSEWCREEYERAKKNQTRFGTTMVIEAYCSKLPDMQLKRFGDRLLLPDPRRAIDEYKDPDEAWYRLLEVIDKCLRRLQRVSWKVH